MIIVQSICVDVPYVFIVCVYTVCMGNKYSKQRDSARVKCYELAALNEEKESELASNIEVMNERSNSIRN